LEERGGRIIGREKSLLPPKFQIDSVASRVLDIYREITATGRGTLHPDPFT